MSTAHERWIPVSSVLLFWGLLLTRVTSHYGNYQGKSLTILMYSMHFAEVKNCGDFFVMDRQRLTIKEVIRELFMDRNSEEEHDENDDESDSSFVPETVPE